MASPVEPQSRELLTSGQALEVDVRSLEKELNALWKSAAEAGESGAIQPVTRAAVVTLVAVVQGDAEVARATERIARVTEHSPCRAIVVNLLPSETSGGESPLGAWASAHCHRVSGGRQVCSEQVTIAAAPAGWTHLPGLIVPLLIPDLPVFLYWPDLEIDGRSEGREFRAELLEHSDYLILDSARSANPAATLLFMSDLAAATRHRQEPRDLNWSRLLPWREALADLFEPVEHRSWLREIEDIEIEALRGDAAPEAGFPARPLLALSWLSERLGWVPRHARRVGDRVEVLFHDDRRASLVLGDGDGTRGALRSLGLKLSQRRKIEVNRPTETAFEALITGEGRETVRRSLPRHVESEESLLCGELDRRGADRIFTAALLRAASLVRSMDTQPGGHQ